LLDHLSKSPLVVKKSYELAPNLVFCMGCLPSNEFRDLMFFYKMLHLLGTSSLRIQLIAGRLSAGL